MNLSKSKFASRLVIIACVASALGCSPEKLAFVGGEVLTMDAEGRVVEAFGIEGERIARVGTTAEIRSWAQAESAEIVTLEGRTVVPGFIDAHGHFPGEGLSEVFVDLNSPPIGRVERMDDLVERLAERAAVTDEDDWVIGFGFDDTLLSEARHPTRHDLDRASNRHPVAVLHISGHLAVVNTKALSLLSIDVSTPDPEGGHIGRDPGSNEPNGLLEETAMEAMRERFLPSPMEGLRMTVAATEMALAQGVTTVQSGLTDSRLISSFDWLTWLGVIPLRMVVWPDAKAAVLIDSGELSRPESDSARINVGAVKLVADGSIQGYTGYLREPYFVPPSDDPLYRGYARIPRDQLIEMVDDFHQGGWQIAIHGNGDASMDDVLDALERAQTAHPRSDTRHVIIHAQMARPDQLDRMKDLGVIPSFFNMHTFYWGDRHRTIFMGPERAARMSPARSAIDRDLLFTLHADAPVVPMQPLRIVWSAVNRKTRSGFELGPDERISAEAALRAITIDAAYQHFEDGEKGSIEQGKLADFVVLSGSPVRDLDRPDSISVLETWIGGERHYRATANSVVETAQ